MRRGKSSLWVRDGVFVIEGARCGWADPNVVVVIKVDYSKGKTRIFDLAEAYSFDRSQLSTLAPYPGGMPGYAMAWLEQHRKDLVEDFYIFYEGGTSPPDFSSSASGSCPDRDWTSGSSWLKQVGILVAHIGTRA